MVWTDPLLPENSAKNASFRLCDNNFHEVLLHKEGDQVTLSVDGHNVTYGAVQQNFFLVDGKFFIGGYPGRSGNRFNILACSSAGRFYESCGVRTSRFGKPKHNRRVKIYALLNAELFNQVLIIQNSSQSSNIVSEFCNEIEQ